MTLLAVPCDADVVMDATGPLRHRCPFVDEIDRGRISIMWRPDGSTIELHALRDWLAKFADAAMSHEAITDLIRHELSLLRGIELLSVETTWETAGMEVRCATSPRLPGPVQ